MKARNIFYFIGASLLVLTVCLFLNVNASDSRQVVAKPIETNGYQAKQQSLHGEVSWPDSPFGLSFKEGEESILRRANVAAREKKMESLGYGSPPVYYDMDLGTLKKLARQGDGDAMLQLAEQYYNEGNFISSDPEFPKNEDPKLLAKQYLANAVGAGYSRAASILAKHYVEENDLINAYAWRLVAEKIGDANNQVWGKNTNQFSSLDEAQLRSAQARFDSIWSATASARMESMRIQVGK